MPYLSKPVQAYLKYTIGQYSLLELSEPGQGLVVQDHEARWLLETFSDSDWSGAKGHRRSIPQLPYTLSME